MSAEVLHFCSVENAPNRIRELRLAQGWPQQRLADAVGVSKVTISDLERGNMQLTQDYMRRIATALRRCPADLLPAKDNPYALSEEERLLIDQLRAATHEQRDQVLKLTDVVIPFPASDTADGEAA